MKLNEALYRQYHEWDNSEFDSLEIVAVLSYETIEIKKAILSMIRTIFVCIVLTFGALIFSKDANDLALRPIERLIEKVK